MSFVKKILDRKEGRKEGRKEDSAYSTIQIL
jgi:hypothetical protein